MKKFEKLIIILIFILGIALRSVEVLNKNYLFGFDNGRDYLAVQRMVNEKRPTLIGSEVGAGFAGLSGIFQGPYYYYSLILPFLIFKGDPYGGLLLMFLLGVAAMVLFYFVVRKIFGGKVALIASFLIAVSPPITSQSRFIWNHHPTTFFIPLVFLTVYLLPKHIMRIFFVANIITGIIYGFELAISVPLLITLYLYTFLVLRVRTVKVYLFGLLGAIIAHLPFFIFEARHGFMATRSLTTVITNQLTGKGTTNMPDLFTRHLADFWNNYQSTFLLSGKLSFILLFLMIYLMHRFLKKKKETNLENFIVFLLLLPLMTFVVFLFLNNTVWDYYLIHLHLAYIILFSYLLVNGSWLKGKILLALLFVLMLPGVGREINRAINDYSDFGGTAKIKGKIEAVDYIYKDAGGENFNLLEFTPPVYDYAYRYLFDWYGVRKYHYLPGDKKEGLYYLLIEPESSGLWHKGWLETVIGPGNVLKEITIPSGFIIQKRNDSNKKI